jgi:3',5'-cyclic AMP phosphodiesterase CpdA
MGSGNNSAHQVLWFSDIHFNPYVDPALLPQLVAADHEQWDQIFAQSDAHGVFPIVGQETNYRLLRASLEDMQRTLARPDMILFTGDFLGHHFIDKYAELTGDSTPAGVQTFIDKTLSYLVATVVEYFPYTPVYFCLGNNDSYEGNYQIARNSPFFSASLPIFAPFFTSEPQWQAIGPTYLQGGHYERGLPQSNGRVLALNSIFFAQYAPELSVEMAMEQLDWLETRLADAVMNKTKVWILLHTPPGVDVYATRMANSADPADADTVVLMSKAEPLARLHDILVRYHAQVGALFAGHIHRDDFRLIRSDDEAAAVTFVVPALSPVYADNPTYKILKYDPETLVVQDYSVRYLDKDTEAWQTGQIFSQAYGHGELNAARMESVWGELRTQSEARANFLAAYNGFLLPYDVSEQTFPFYWAAIGALDSESYLQTVRDTTFPSLLVEGDRLPLSPLWFDSEQPPVRETGFANSAIATGRQGDRD